MELEEAKELLNGCVRQELRDHAFGDTEVIWLKGEDEIASGYFGGGSASVYVQGTNFNDSEARELKFCGAEGHISRNDETGPDVYVEGQIMPGLTLEGVRKELTGE